MRERATDAALVTAARRKDPSSFEQLVERHGSLVYRVAYRLLGSQEDAHDCAQESWIQAWRHLPDFRGTSAFSTWMYRLTTNQALMMLRKRKRTYPLDEEQEQRARDDDQSEHTLVRLTVRGAMHRLSPDERTVLVLREFEGLAVAEVADILGIAVPAAKQRLRRARLALAREMTGEWHE